MLKSRGSNSEMIDVHRQSTAKSASKTPVHSRILGASVTLIAACSSSSASPKALSCSPLPSKATDPASAGRLRGMMMMMMMMMMTMTFKRLLERILQSKQHECNPKGKSWLKMVYQTMDPSLPAPCPQAFMEERFEVTSSNETTPEKDQQLRCRNKQGGTDLRGNRYIHFKEP